MRLLIIFSILIIVALLSSCNMKESKNDMIHDDLDNFIKSTNNDFDDIPADRKKELNDISDYIAKKIKNGSDVNLTFICTHNSRRSHMSQIAAQTAAYYYGIKNVNCFSGGTESTAFNPRAVKAIMKAGYEVEKQDESDNPVYIVEYAEEAPAIQAFSKKFDDQNNPQKNFAAVMTCSDADQNCPYVPGAEQRFAIPYDDPKEFDGTSLEEEKYDERLKQISTEMFFIFSNVK